MKGFVKMIIAGSIVLGIGIAVLIIALGANGWKFDNFGSSEFEMKSYSAKAEVGEVKIEFYAGQLEIVFYDGDGVKVDYPENDKYTSEVKEENGKLSVISKKRHWYDWVNWAGCNTSFPTTTVSLPSGSKISLDLHLNAGTVNVADGEYGNADIYVNAGTVNIGEITCGEFGLKLNAGTVNAAAAVCDKLQIKMNAGTASIDKISCNDIYTKVNAGSMNLAILGNENEYTVIIEKNAGSCNVSDRQGADPSKKISGGINAGSLNIIFKN